MKTSSFSFINRFVLVFLLVFLTACNLGTHPLPGAPKEMPQVKADFEDVIAWVFGWSSWEESVQGDPMLILVSNEDGSHDTVMAFPQPLVAGTLGAKWVESGQASVIGEGEAYAARLQTSLYAIQEALHNAPLTQRWIDPSRQYMVALKPYGADWYYGFVDMTKTSMFTICRQSSVCGAFTNSTSIRELTDTLQANGWKAVPASAIPAAIKTAMLTRMGYLQNAWFIRLSGTVTSPIFFFGSSINIPYQILVPNWVPLDEIPQN